MIKSVRHLVIISLTLLIVSLPAYADKLEGGGYTLDANTNNSGAGTLKGGGYILQDLKGQPAAGKMTGDGYELDIGGIYNLGGEGEVELPHINIVSLFLEGYFKPDLEEMDWPDVYLDSVVPYPQPTVAIELRKASGPDSPANANQLVGKCIVPLNKNGTGTNNGEWAIEPSPPGPYYIVVKRKVGNVEGCPHLSFITDSVVQIQNGQVLNLNFSNPNLLDEITSVYKPVDDAFAMEPLRENNGYMLMRLGDVDHNTAVNILDKVGAWLTVYNEYNDAFELGGGKILADNDPFFALGDFDGDGHVNILDVVNNWLNGYNQTLGKSDVHVYVPDIVQP